MSLVFGAGSRPVYVGQTKHDRLALPKIWEETKMLKHGDTVMRFLKIRGTDIIEKEF